MTQPDEFDQFYKDVRTRLLLLTYCLTGDLPSSRAAVRDAFVVAWHHWRKVSRRADPEAWVREHACRHAQRRHTAKLWHREKDLDPEIRATLDALARLTLTQRRVLLITELTRSSLTDMSREVGLPRPEAERELQLATSQFALHREVPTTSVRTVLESVRVHVETVSWPRATILRRAGTTRRRTHTIIGVATVAAALVVGGTVAGGTDGVRPTLAGERVTSAAGAAAEGPSAVDVPDSAMLAPEVVTEQLPGPAWSATGTHDNSTGTGLVMTCQTERYADPTPDDALVRTFARPATSTGPSGASVVQATASSRNERRAHRAYAQAVAWFAGCRQDRAQLLDTYAVPGLGDESVMMRLRTWDQPQRTLVAGVARTGQFTTATVASAPVSAAARPAAVARLLAAGVDELCKQPKGGACSSGSAPAVTAPVPVAPARAMLSEVDLPPLDGVRQPWVGTTPRRAVVNAAATHCDETVFKGVTTRNRTRTFLIPDARLPREFGLTETIGVAPAKRARAMLATARDRMKRCPDKQMGTDVTQLRDVRRGGLELTAWKVTTEVTDDRTITFWMGLVRDRTAVAQIGFVPARGAAMSRADFEALVERAQQRLSAIPAR